MWIRKWLDKIQNIKQEMAHNIVGQDLNIDENIINQMKQRYSYNSSNSKNDNNK